MAIPEATISDFLKPINGSAIRAIFHLLGQPGMISFAGGNPASSALEPDVIARLTTEVLQARGASLLQYGATEGFAPFRESVADFVESAGFKATPESILPTQGSQQALDLLIKATCNPGDVVLVESPTFLGALQAFHTYCARVVPLESDGEGVDVDAAEAAIKAHKPKLIYLIPTFQNPTGKTLPLERRRRMAELANRYGVILAEDDPYRDVRFTGAPLPSIKSFDEEDWVVYLGSFSKIISPGLRVGYAVVPDALLRRKMTIAKQSVDVHSPTLNQAIVDRYLREGLMPAHLKRIAGDYRAQLSMMLDKLSAWPDGVAFTRPEGGLFVWVELPESLDAAALLQEATERHVAYVPGTHFFEGGGHLNTLRLNFSNSSPADIARGMDILGGLIAEKLR